MNSWLVTGGAGFIGSNFARMLSRKKDQEVVILDALTYAGNLANISDLLALPHVKFVKGDICDSGPVIDLFERHPFTRVIHFAAESHVDRSILGAWPFIKTNVEGTLTLLEAARKVWSDKAGCRFLHVSTDEVYGSLKRGDPSFNENSPYRPNSPYAVSKAAADHLVRAWHHTYELPVLISNCSNNYGPWQFPEKLIPLTIMNALEGKELPIYGDGLQIRDWLHVEDHCAALLAVIEKGNIGETYTIGARDERTNIEVVKMICKSVDQLTGNSPGTSERLIRYVKDRPGHDRRYAIDNTRLQKELGWRALHVFEETLPDVVSWYIAHKDWADAIRTGEYLHYYQRQYGER